MGLLQMPLKSSVPGNGYKMQIFDSSTV